MPIVAVPVSAPSVSRALEHRSADSRTSLALRSYAFGHFILIPARQLLVKNGTPVRIGGRALDILVALVERPGELIGKQDLVSRAWPNTFVDEANLKVNMASLRRALGESHATPQYIATVVGRGYRFVAAVRSSEDTPGTPIDRSSLTAARIASLLEAVEGIRQELEQLGLASREVGEHAGNLRNPSTP